MKCCRSGAFASRPCKSHSSVCCRGTEVEVNSSQNEPNGTCVYVHSAGGPLVLQQQRNKCPAVPPPYQ